MPRILIGVFSGWKHRDRRSLCRATWMRDANDAGIEALFLLGCPATAQPERLGKHALVLPCPDDYASLPQRTRWFCRWAIRLTSPSGRGAGGEGWDYLFKCDDDSYVSIPRLLSYDLAGRDYVGAEWKPGINYGSGGAGYFLSRRAAAIVAEKLTQATGAEDLLVGQVLRAAGIPLSIEPRLIPFGSIERRPTRGNDLLTTHAVDEATFLASHAETREKPKSKSEQNPRPRT